MAFVKQLLSFVTDKCDRGQEEDRHSDGSEFTSTYYFVFVVYLEHVWLKDLKQILLCQMLSLMETQAQFFQQGHTSLSELEEYRQKLNEEVCVSV